MPLLCPNCREPLDLDALVCPNRHRFVERDGVLVLLETSFERRLIEFADRLTAIRASEGKRLLDASAYEGLPFSQLDAGDAAWRNEWRLRAYDLEIVVRLLSKRAHQCILDVGAWNGWLSHRLALCGHDVTAVDYFADEYDGLGARRRYSTHWRAIQVDLSDLSVLGEHFDVVILNRCLQFFADPPACIEAARPMLASGGMLIATGLQFFRDTRVKARQVEATRKRYRDRFDFELFLRPTKAYLDFGDLRQLRTSGLTLKQYPQLWRANLKSMLRPALPRHLYGVCVVEPGR